MSRKRFLQKLHIYGKEHNIPNITLENESFLRKTISENIYTNILEVWSANGYSTICFADEVEKNNGKVTSIEFSQKAYEDAQENFELAGVSDLIDYYFGDARDIIPFLEEKYDFIFIDGLKKASLQFYLCIKDKLLPWGTIIIDDVIKYRYKMENLYTYLENNKIAYKILKIDADDGIMIIKK